MKNRKKQILDVLRVMSMAICLNLFVLAGCSNLISAGPAKLRIRNDSDVEFNKLAVDFPGGHFIFKNIRPGGVSEYQNAPRGVYSYGFIRLNDNRKVLPLQPIDYVGEEPMSGSAFTYKLSIVHTRNGSEALDLSGVTTDR